MITFHLIHYYSLLFSLSLVKFWPLHSVFTKILANTTLEFGILFILIILSLLANSFRHLIYKVLNLGVLSILVAAIWAYTTDLSFVYVVYILAFVGAVIMLFLSVILMLPSSAVASSTRVNSSLLFTLSFNSSLSDFYLTSKHFIIVLLTVIALSVVLFVIASIQLAKLPPTLDELILNKDHPLAAKVALSPADPLSDRFNIATYNSNYDFYICENADDISVLSACSVEHFYNLNGPALTVTSEKAVVSQALFLIAVPKSIFDDSSSNALRLIGSVVRELVEYYFLVVEEHYLRSIISLASSAKIFSYARYIVGGIHTNRNRNAQDLRVLATYNKKRFPIQTTDSRSGARIVICTYTPWWSPFRILSQLPSFNTMAFPAQNVIHRMCFRALRSLRGVFRAFYSFASLFYSFYARKYLLPLEVVSTLRVSFANRYKLDDRALTRPQRFRKYLLGKIDEPLLIAGVMPLSFSDSAFILVFNCTAYFILDFLRPRVVRAFRIFRVKIILWLDFELFVQVITQLSIYLLCVPLSSYAYSTGVDLAASSAAESLGAIQHLLYVGNPLLMLTSVTGLLVALMGAATIHRTK